LTDLIKNQITFEEAFQQAINSMTPKDLIILSNSILVKALHTMDAEDAHKAKVQHILTN
jgi:hypothetical protein